MSTALKALKGREAFDRVYAEGRRWRGAAATVVVRESADPGVRVGISVGRAAGGAVQRNRLRRRVREALRHLAGRMRSGYDVVVIARPEAGGRPFDVLVRDLEILLGQAGLLGEEGGRAAEGTP